ncbi:MAG: polysaccharide deacetylase family protein [Pseudonocardiaceae bacterium]
MKVHYRTSHPWYRSDWLLVTLAMLGTAALLVVQIHLGGAPVDTELMVGVAAPAPPPNADPPPAPAAPVAADLIRHTARPDRAVALTFDDGPHRDYTPHVLALLTQYHAVATFCMVGSEAVRHPELVREVVSAGMRLCDHTITHDRRLIDRPEPQIEAEIVGCRADLLAAAGTNVSIDYFRAPAGRWSEPIQRIAARNGMKPLAWSVDPRDWSQPGTARIVADVQQQVHPGAVILLHDGGGQRDQTVAALAELLPWLVAQGYQFDVPA